MRPVLWQTEEVLKDVEDLGLWLEKTMQSRWTGRDLVLLQGPMGVGKTQFTRLLAQSLGVGDEVASPTFAIHHHYQGQRQSLDHLDLYRIENDEELESTGFWDLFARDHGMIVVEWADRLDFDALPNRWSVWVINLQFVESAPNSSRADPSVRRLTVRQFAAQT